MSEEIMIKVDNVSKEYKLGQIGGTTLREELQRLGARIRHKEDPTKKIGSKNYNNGESFLALDRVSFEIKKGERVGIIGKNGAGKSTLLKLISRITGPSSGSIGLNGRVASMLEVGTGFHPELTGRENIYMNGAILGMTKKEIDAKIEKIIDFSEVRQFIDTPVKRYSSGMYVKLAFSVAAHLDSEIMIMDEVLAVGDQAFQKKCIEKMNSVSHDEGKTILYVSHHINTIRELCTRCIVLNKGKLVFDGDVETAISIYLDRELREQYAMDITPEMHKDWVSNPSVQMLYSEFKNSTSNSFSSKEPINVLIRWKNLRDVNNLCFRLEVKTYYYEPVATALAYDFYSGSKDEIAECTFSLDMSQLHTGKYALCYLFFYRDMFGNAEITDCVNGLVVDLSNLSSEIKWDSNAWGPIELPHLKNT